MTIDLKATGAVPTEVRGTLGLPYNVKIYGAAGDGIRVPDAAITSGTDDLTSASGVFTAGDVGKTIIVDGAGASGAALTTTISAYVSATAVTLAANASTTVSGAVATFGTDDTTAIEAAVAAAMGTQIAPAGTVLFPASDWYIYNGNGIDADQRLAIVGIDRMTSRVVLGTGKYLVKTTGYCDRFTMSDLTVWGGKGAYQGTFTSANTTGSKVFERCDFRLYTECAISTESSDSPDWWISKCVFAPANSTGTIGVALAVDASGTVIRDNAFQGGRIGVKLRGAGLSVTVEGNSFVAFDAGLVGSPRAKVWLVPYTSATNGGNGCRIVGNKFGNENLEAWDDHVLIADEGAGATNSVKMPERGSASTGHAVDLSVQGNRFTGGGSGRASVFCTTPNLIAHYGLNFHDGSTPSYMVEFLSGVTPASTALLTVDKQLSRLTVSNKSIFGGGSEDDPLNLGFATNILGETAADVLTMGAANRAVYARVINGCRAATKVRFVVGTSSGNVSVGAYRNLGQGIDGTPGTLLAKSGSVACPSAGAGEVSLGSTIDVKPGDWLALSVDNNTATFAAARTLVSATPAGKGRMRYEETAFPLPTTPTPSGDAIIGPILLEAIP